MAKKKAHRLGAKRLARDKEKVVGMVDHFFGNISVAAFRLKSPLKVGDMIHVKGHTTDFVQRVDSIQANHKDLSTAKKGAEIGIKVKGKCREGDTVFLAAPPAVKPAAPKPQGGYSEKKFFSF